jgi:hypothetical protein
MRPTAFVLAALLAAGLVVWSGCGGGSPGRQVSAPTPVEPPVVVVPPTNTTPPTASEELPPIGTGTAVLAGAGDIGDCDSPGPALTSRLLEGIDAQVFLAGDIGYPGGGIEDIRRCFDPAWGRFRSRWRPAPGNHEYEQANARGYFDYFGAAAGPDRRGYYSFRAASWLVLMLNSSVPVRSGSAQYQWVADELRNNRTRCAAAVWHHPYASSGPHGPHNFLRDLWQLLVEGGVDVAIAAHEHLYERFAPLDRDHRLDTERGIRQFTVGTGGARLYTAARRLPGSEMLVSRFGVLKLTLQPGFYEWDHIDAVNRSSNDRGSAQCH